MDIAVDLVESYLRLSGYLTVSEFEVQRRGEGGGFETATDVDIVALRLPGDVFAGDPHEGDDCNQLLIEDPVLGLEPHLIDVIIGEVKQGEADFNAGIRRHEVLHTVLQRVGWLFAEPLEVVVAALQNRDQYRGPARGGGEIRARLVAFGRSPHDDRHTISHTHVVETVLAYLSGLDDAFRPVQFRDPAPAMLSLLHKVGFEVRKDPESAADE